MLGILRTAPLAAALGVLSLTGAVGAASEARAALPDVAVCPTWQDLGTERKCRCGALDEGAPADLSGSTSTFAPGAMSGRFTPIAAGAPVAASGGTTPMSAAPPRGAPGGSEAPEPRTAPLPESFLLAAAPPPNDEAGQSSGSPVVPSKQTPGTPPASEPPTGPQPPAAEDSPQSEDPPQSEGPPQSDGPPQTAGTPPTDEPQPDAGPAGTPPADDPAPQEKTQESGPEEPLLDEKDLEEVIEAALPPPDALEPTPSPQQARQPAPSAQVTAVPEPSSIALLLTLGALLCGYRLVAGALRRPVHKV